MHEVLKQTAHRPHPLPDRPWVMRMAWRDLLFAHWPVRPDALRPLLPPVVELDTFDGWAWLGVVPFAMADVRPRLVPRALALSFLELNVRTYVKTPDRSGVWFFSLDASSALAVWAARLGYGLPYFHAQAELRHEDDGVSYASRRDHRRAVPAELEVRYRPIGDVYASDPGSLDRWLTERYLLVVEASRGGVAVGDIHHLPWPLQPAEAEFATCRMTEQIGVSLPSGSPVLHYAAHLDVVAWTAKPVG